MFHFKVYIEVFHDNRDIEFILFKRWVEDTLVFIYGHGFQNKSCEMLSGLLAQQINIRYPNRKIKIEISEDGENGTEFTYEKKHNKTQF